KNRDQREERDREAFRDSRLGHFGRPRHQGGGAEDRDGEQQRLERWRFVNGAGDVEAHERRRQRQQRGTCHESPLLSRVSQFVGRPFVRHEGQPYQRPARAQSLSGPVSGAHVSIAGWTPIAFSPASPKATTKDVSYISSTSPRARRPTPAP